MTDLVALLRELAVRRGQFTLASGRTSDFYVDARRVTLHAKGSRLVAEAFLSVLPADVVGIGGLTLGADPIACGVATLAPVHGRSLHAFLVRKEAKAHGTGSRVEGLSNFQPGDRVAVVEDTTTTGGSLLAAIDAATEAGLVVASAITLVDREEGASDALAARGHRLVALTTRTQLLG